MVGWIHGRLVRAIIARSKPAGASRGDDAIHADKRRGEVGNGPADGW